MTELSRSPHTEPRRPTEADYAARRSYCCIHVVASACELSAKLYPGHMQITVDRGGARRIGALGTIKNIVLVAYQHQSSSEYAGSGNMLDYAENCDGLDGRCQGAA